MKVLNLFSKLFLLLGMIAITNQNVQAQVSIVPAPNHLKLGNGFYQLDVTDVIEFTDDQVKPLADYLREQVFTLTDVNVKIAQRKSKEKGINLLIDTSISDNIEAYSLDIKEDYIKVVGASKQGLMFGIQSLLQVIYPYKKNGEVVEVPVLTVKDQPTFKWRGMHLDVCRHFYSVEFREAYA